MIKRAILLAAIVAGLSVGARADGLPADEQAFFDKHISDVVKVVPTRLADPAVVKVFSAAIYKVDITIDLGGGATSADSLVTARVDDKFVPVCRPGSDGDCPDIEKMIRPDFKLVTDDDAKTVQAALNQLYPILGDQDKTAEKFTHSGNEFAFARGKFFDKLMGFVLTTDASGTVTSVKYVLKLP